MLWTLRTMATRLMLVGCLCAATLVQAHDTPQGVASSHARHTSSDVPGIAVALVDHGRVVAEAVGGDADRSTHRQLTRHTRFAVGDVSKLYAALVALRLSAQKRLDLDAPITRYVSGYTPGSGMSTPTLRQLLSQQGGLMSNWLHGMYHRPGAPVDAPPASAFRPVLAPGRIHGYSNLGIALAIRAMQAATGSTYPHLLRSLVLNPLRSIDIDAVPRPADARGHRHGDVQPQLEAREAGASGLRANLVDMEQLLIALTAGNRALPTAALQNPQDAHAPLNLSRQDSFGLQLSRDPRAALGTVAHLHAFFPGSEVRLRWWPQQHVAVVVMIDSGDGDTQAIKTVTDVSDAWFIAHGIAKLPKPGRPQTPYPLPSGAVRAKAAARYVSPFGLIRVRRDGTSLHAKALGLDFRATPRSDGWYAISLEVIGILPLRVGPLRRTLVTPVRLAGDNVLVASYRGRDFPLGLAWTPHRPDRTLHALAGTWTLANPDALSKRFKVHQVQLVVDKTMATLRLSIPVAPLFHLHIRMPLEQHGPDTLALPGLAALLGSPVHVLHTARGPRLEFLGYRFRRSHK